MTDAMVWESRPVRVTFHEDRAEVVRRARGHIAAGTAWMSLAGAGPYLQDRSLQARCIAGGAEVLAARVRRRVTQQSDAGREQIDLLEAEERASRQKLTEATRVIERAQAARRRVTALIQDWRKALAQIPQDARGERLTEWREAYRALDAQLTAALDAEVQGSFARQQAQDELARAQARLGEARATHPVCEALLQVQLRSAAEAEVEVEVVYRTPCALWRPEHVARLATADGAIAGTGSIEITTWATAWQATGETWDGVEAVFSTARPAHIAAAPTLQDDVLTLRHKTDAERQVISAEVHEQQVARIRSGDGARLVDEMPGVDDGGVPLSFRAAAPITMRPTGLPLRVEIGSVQLAARVERVLVPELSPAAHVRATATLTGATPLLAGPLVVGRGTGLSGRARLDFVAPGESFVVGFGPDDSVRVRRTHEEKDERAAITGTRKIERKVHVFLSNLSDSAARVLVTERIPVSEIGGVEIELLDSKSWKHDAQDGFLSAEVELAPRSGRELELCYEVRAKSNVALHI